MQRYKHFSDNPNKNQKKIVYIPKKPKNYSIFAFFVCFVKKN